MLYCLGMEHNRFIITTIPKQLVFCVYGNFAIWANNLVGGIQQGLGFLLGKALVVDNLFSVLNSSPAVGGHNIWLHLGNQVVNAGVSTGGAKSNENAFLLALLQHL